MCPVSIKPYRELIKCPNSVKRKKVICPVGVKPHGESIKYPDSVEIKKIYMPCQS